MFCPVCRDEYRPGFTRCEPCGAALVESLDVAAPSSPTPLLAEEVPEDSMAVFCGFLTLDEARQARDKAQAAKMPAEILIRQSPGTAAGAPLQEDFWLRIRPRDFKAMEALIGFEPAVATGEEAFKCSACGETVHAADDACPGCGLRFEE